MREPHYGCKDMACGCVPWPFFDNAERKIQADEGRWRDSYPIWVPCCLMIPFGWLFRGRKWPNCKKTRHRQRWEEERKQQREQKRARMSSGKQTMYPETRISPSSLRPRRDEDNISNFELDPRMSLGYSMLNRLPLELRQQIYGYVLGQQRNLVLLLPFKIRAVPDEYGTHYRPLDAEFNGRLINSSADKRFWPQRTALLRTCRQVYAETVGLLYTANTFVIKHPEILSRFAKSIPAQRLNTIRSLHISLSLRRHPNLWNGNLIGKAVEWKQLWQMIAGVEHLKTLEVEVPYLAYQYQNPCYENALEPISKIRGLNSFRLDFRMIRSSSNGLEDDCEVFLLSESTQSLVQRIEATVILPRQAKKPGADRDCGGSSDQGSHLYDD